MRQQTARYAFFLILTACLATATTVDVTTTSQVTLATGDSLIFTLSESSSSSHYPGEIEMLLGTLPLTATPASIPGTSSVYMPGILFDGTFESEDGSESISLTDANAARLSLATGDMVLTPGSRSGGSYSGPIDLLSAAATLTPAESSAFFSSGDVTIELQNIGAPITFGYPGTAIGNDFTASLVSQDGTQSFGARVMRVECERNNTPEPGTIGLLIIGLTVIATRIALWGRRPSLQRVSRPAR